MQTWDTAFGLFWDGNLTTDAERRRMGIQFLAQVLDDLPSLPVYCLKAYVGPLFQVRHGQAIRTRRPPLHSHTPGFFPVSNTAPGLSRYGSVA